MKKKTITVLLALVVVANAFSQVTSTDGTFSTGSGSTNMNLQTGTTARLTVLGSNGNIGINTASPLDRLHVNGTIRSGNVYSTTGHFNVAHATNTMTLATNSITRVVILQNGNVGIGTGSPTELLDVNGTGRIRSISQNDTLTRILAADTNGKIFWREVTSLSFDVPYVYDDANLGIGYNSLINGTTSEFNTAFGAYSAISNTEGDHNTAVGFGALYSNTTANYNSAFGSNTLVANTTGTENTAIGTLALVYSETGSGNTAVGYFAGPPITYIDLNNTTALGNGAAVTASDQVRIGNASVTSIGGQVSWSTLSDGRFKKEIRQDVSGLEFINQLKPVSYSVDRDAIDKFLGTPDSIRSRRPTAKRASERRTGFVAQEVEEVVKKAGFVFHGIDAPQNDKDHYSIRYAEFVVPLVKAVQELSAQVTDQKKQIELLQDQLEAKIIGENALSKHEVVLFQNNPNPFTLDTNIKMTIPENAGKTTLIVYNLEGKQLKEIQVLERGNATVRISGNELQPGMYLYTLLVDGKVIDTKRMILTK